MLRYDTQPLVESMVDDTCRQYSENVIGKAPVKVTATKDRRMGS